jgi:putative DNA methylase
VNRPGRRKLIEVALPLEAIDAACKADKDRKTGTIRNVHKWFAPMPVPAWRALLFAALVDDPEDQADRERLRKLIEDLVSTGVNPPPPHVVALAQDEIRRSNPQGLPTITDPFCGGGSTLVEAQRLGLSSHGSDLSPVAVLITRTLCDLVPAALKAKDDAADRLLDASLDDLRDDVMKHASAVGERVRLRISGLYPPLGDGLVPYAWIWVRTAPCPNPACRLTTPLVTSWCLSAKRGAEVFARPVIVDNHVQFEVVDGVAAAPREAKTGRASFSCVRCETVLTTSYLRDVAKREELGLRLLAVAAMKGKARVFVAPTSAQEATLELSVEIEPFLRVPIQRGALGIQVPLWGME